MPSEDRPQGESDPAAKARGMALEIRAACGDRNVPGSTTTVIARYLAPFVERFQAAEARAQRAEAEMAEANLQKRTHERTIADLENMRIMAERSRMHADREVADLKREREEHKRHLMDANDDVDNLLRVVEKERTARQQAEEQVAYWKKQTTIVARQKIDADYAREATEAQRDRLREALAECLVQSPHSEGARAGCLCRWCKGRRAIDPSWGLSGGTPGLFDAGARAVLSEPSPGAEGGGACPARRPYIESHAIPAGQKACTLCGAPAAPPPEKGAGEDPE